VGTFYCGANIRRARGRILDWIRARLFGWKRGATDYRVSALPLGGYVRMAGQDPSEIDSARSTAIHGKGREDGRTGSARASAGERRPDELMNKPRWQRAIISVCRSAGDLVFPILLLTVLLLSR